MLKNLLALLFVAVDGGEGDSEGTPESASPENTPEPTDTEPTDTNTGEPETPKFEIDGEEFDLDTIKEWRQGHLRQADYTRKTQEIAKMRKELEAKEAMYKDAIEVYQFLQANPTLTQQLYQSALEEGQEAPHIKQEQRPTTDPRVDQVLYELEVQKIENELQNLLKQDPDVNDVELLNIANEKNMDLQTAYIFWKGQNVDNIVKKKQQELTNKMKKNADSTATLINPSDKGVTKSLGLTETEIAMAKRLDMSAEEYAKWKTYNPNR